MFYFMLHVLKGKETCPCKNNDSHNRKDYTDLIHLK